MMRNTLGKLLILCVVVTCCLISNAAADAKVTPYHGYAADNGKGFFADAEGWHFFSGGHATRIVQTGNITSMEFYAANTAGVSSFALEIWRKNEATGLYARVYQSANYKAWLKDGYNKIEFDTVHEIPVLEGDSFGIYMYGTNDAYHGSLGTTTSDADWHAYWAASRTPSTTAMDWYSGADIKDTGSLSAALYMRSPEIVVFGDSIISGSPNFEAFTDQWEVVANRPDIDRTKSIPYKLGALSGKTYQNMGIHGNRMADMAMRFDADVLQKHPKYVVLEGGVNDLVNSVPASGVLPSIKKEILDCQHAGIYPIVLLITPAYGYLNQAQSIQADELNTLIIQYNAVNPGFKVVDTRSTLGTYSGTNGWTLKPQYAYDTVHLNEAGNAVIAQAVYDSYFLSPPAQTVYGIGDQVIHATQGDIIHLNVSSNFPGTTYHYVIDGVSSESTSGELAYTVKNAGYLNITVYGEAADGSTTDTFNYSISASRAMATQSINKLDTSHTANLTNAVLDQNITAYMENMPYPWTDLIGKTFYLIIFAIPFVFIRINTGSLEMPLILFLLVGWMVIGFVPIEWHYMVYITFSMGIMAVLYSMIKERG